MDATIADNLLLEEKREIYRTYRYHSSTKSKNPKISGKHKGRRIQENKEPDKNILEKRSLETIIEAEFLNNICTNGTEHSEIAFYEGTHDNNVFISLEKNKIKTFLLQI